MAVNANRDPGTEISGDVIDEVKYDDGFTLVVEDFNGNLEFLMLDSNGKRIASLDTMFVDSSVVDLHYLHVREDGRNKGVGARVYKSVIDYFINQKPKITNIEAVFINRPSVNLGTGYKPEGWQANYMVIQNRDGSPAILDGEERAVILQDRRTPLPEGVSVSLKLTKTA